MATADQSVSQSSDIDSSPPLSRWSRVLFWLFTSGPLTVWFIGTLLRLTIRDRYPIPFVGAVFYATPLPFLFALAMYLTLRTRRLGWVRTSAFLALSGFVELVLWIQVVFQPVQPEPPTNALRVAFWNISHGTFGYEDVTKELLAMDADVIAMTEAHDEGQSRERWNSLLPEYKVLPLKSGMLMLVRGEAKQFERGKAGNVCDWRIADVSVRGVRFKFGVVDFAARPSRYRKPGFVAMSKLFDRFADQPFVFAGDLNTPPESAFMGLLRDQATNAFETSGEGFRETWPVFAPMLTLDQLWGNSQIKWHRCRHLWSLRSDHRPVVAEFEIVNVADE